MANSNKNLGTVIFLSALMLATVILFSNLIPRITHTENLPTEPNGGIPVNVQDQTSTPIDFFFTQINGAPTTVNQSPGFDTYTVNVTSTVSCSVGDYFGMFNADNETNNRAYFGDIQSILGNNITLDTPIDFVFQPGDTAGCFNRNLAVDGSLNRQTFSIQVGPNANQCIDITRLMFSFITDDPVDLSKFGDIAGGLANGFVIRRVDGETNNFWNVKTNGEIANLCFDYDPFAATNPVQGQNGAKFRCTFAGQEKHGVAIRLCPGDSLEGLIQDDLSSINQLRIIAEGHYVVNGIA